MKVVSKRFTFFGNTTDFLFENVEVFANKYPLPEFSITRFADNVNPLDQRAGLLIKNLKRKESIKISTNRIDFEYEGKLPSFEMVKDSIRELLSIKNEVCYSRIAVGVSLIEPDKKNVFKTKLSNCIHNSFQNINDYSFRLNDVAKIGEEEVNCILSSNTGFIQEIKIVNNMQFPQLISSLFFNIDINTSQKNSVERFTGEHINNVFPLLDQKSTDFIRIVEEIINNEK